MPNEAMVLMNKSTCALKPWVYSLPGQELCNFLSNRSAFPTPVGVNRTLPFYILGCPPRIAPYGGRGLKRGVRLMRLRGLSIAPYGGRGLKPECPENSSGGICIAPYGGRGLKLRARAIYGVGAIWCRVFRI